MADNEKSPLSKFVSSAWRNLNLLRIIILNIVFFIILYQVLSFFARTGPPSIPGSTALVVTPRGAVVEQLKAMPQLPLPGMAPVYSPGETLLKDLVDAIDAGKDDSRVKVLVLNLNYLGSAGLTKLQDLGAAIKRFRATGKRVFAYADNYTRNSYYLAAYADEIHLPDMGMVILDGYSRYRRYYKEGLDKLEVDIHLFRVGKFKSAAEPYIRSNMSDEAKESNIRWLNALWDSYLQDIATERNTRVESLKNYSNNFPALLKKSGGNSAQLALAAEMVDYLSSREEFRQHIIEIVGEDEDTHSFYRIGHDDYIDALNLDRWGEDQGGSVVGVVVASGTILDGHQPPGSIGGDSTAALIREARMDKDVKAILFRVDSGGGSAFASEIIRKELALARKQGIPVVASMGSVAASGGYWVCMAADEIWTYPSTITGSIGIFGMFPTIQKPLAKFLGIRVDGVGTNELAGALRPDREMAPNIKNIIQQFIDQGYDEFISVVSKARKTSKEKIHEVAQGRVWIGSDAHKLGLVDKLGGFSQALDSAASMAKLGDKYKIKYFRKKPSARQKLLQSLLSKNTDHTRLSPKTNLGQPLNPVREIMRILHHQLQQMSFFNDPRGVYAYCLEDVDF
jgi:protease IV